MFSTPRVVDNLAHNLETVIICNKQISLQKIYTDLLVFFFKNGLYPTCKEIDLLPLPLPLSLPLPNNQTNKQKINARSKGLGVYQQSIHLQEPDKNAKR